MGDASQGNGKRDIAGNCRSFWIIKETRTGTARWMDRETGAGAVGGGTVTG